MENEKMLSMKEIEEMLRRFYVPELESDELPVAASEDMLPD